MKSNKLSIFVENLRLWAEEIGSSSWARDDGLRQIPKIVVSVIGSENS